MQTLFKTEEWTAKIPDDVGEVQQWSRHQGWCTQDEDIANSYLGRGQVVAFYRNGKRRPSRQLYISTDGSTFEFKKSGNVSDDVVAFLESNKLEETAYVHLPALKQAVDGFELPWRSRWQAPIEQDENLPEFEIIDVLQCSMSPNFRRFGGDCFAQRDHVLTGYTLDLEVPYDRLESVNLECRARFKLTLNEVEYLLTGFAVLVRYDFGQAVAQVRIEADANIERWER